MALIKCYECGKEISDTTKCCVNCGAPVKSNYVEENNYENDSQNSYEDNFQDIITKLVIIFVLAFLVMFGCIISVKL